MNTYKKNGDFFLCPEVKTITNSVTQEIFTLLKSQSNKTVVIDLDGVENCSNSFFYILQKFRNIKLLNPESGFLSLLYMTGFDRYVKIFGEEVSLEENKRELINRKFCVV